MFRIYRALRYIRGFDLSHPASKPVIKIVACHKK